MNNLPNIDELVDIQNIKINKRLSKEDKISQFLKDIKNPYCFKLDDTIIKIKYAQGNSNLQECVKNYIESKILPH